MANITLSNGPKAIRNMTVIDWSDVFSFPKINRDVNRWMFYDGPDNFAQLLGYGLKYGGNGPGGLKSGTVTALQINSVGMVIFEATSLFASAARLSSAYINSDDASFTKLLLAGNDLVHATDRPETLMGYSGADVIYGFGGNDKIFGGIGNDKIFGGVGNDILLGEQGDDFLLGGQGDDILYGDLGKDTLHGGAGKDGLYGGDGSDLIYGGLGNDTIYAGIGNDQAYGGQGNDVLFGEAGNDRLLGDDGQDAIYGGTGHDTIYGGAGRDTLFGEVGNDRIFGGLGDDWIAGGPGYDTLQGDSGNDTLYGEAGADRLVGGEGNDHIFGGAGNDSLLGGIGADRLYGGAGADIFIFTTVQDSLLTTCDYIDDFNSAQNDKIDLSRIDANRVLPGNQDLVYIGAHSFSGVAGQLRWTRTGQSTHIQADINGDGIADFTIIIGKSVDVSFLDFIL